MSTVAEFVLDLERFGLEVEADATRVFREASQLAAEAVIVGNQYGPGAPTDTGFLRSSFRVGVGAPASGPSTPPVLPGRQPGDAPVFPPPMLGPELVTASLDQPLFVATNVGYAEYLELLDLRRRFGPFEGQPTTFIRPVEARWPRIVEDAMRRLGVGEPGAPPS